MSGVTDLEKRLRARPDDFELRRNEAARRILRISASSAQSERDFSSVGRTVTDMRSRLSADKIEAIELVRWGKRAGLADD